MSNSGILVESSIVYLTEWTTLLERNIERNEKTSIDME